MVAQARGSAKAPFPHRRRQSYSCSMSEDAAQTMTRKPEGPPRVPGARAVRPKNMAPSPTELYRLNKELEGNRVGVGGSRYLQG